MTLGLDDLLHGADPELDLADDIDATISRCRRHLHVLVVHGFEQSADQLLECVGIHLEEEVAEGLADGARLVSNRSIDGRTRSFRGRVHFVTEAVQLEVDRVDEGQVTDR